MIKECILEKTGIEFDMEYLKDLDFDFEELQKMFERGDYDESIEKCGWHKDTQEISRLNEKDANDLIYDKLRRFWWILELFPMLTSYQDSQGNWFRRRT